ncbi:MAG: threonine ammonia-lyase, biosynthetic, partial [Myxococcota bacterium]|nr:threonine ammonia-lyase, biosynthetic [Myxococcota bacterium]
MLVVSLKKILDAQVYDVAVESPLQEAELLSRRLGHRVLIKREDLQPVFSFKLRGAYNKIRQLSEEERAKGIIAASAGNHAQGVALAAARLGIEAVIVMPETTPEIKVTSVRDRGARVVLWGDTFDEACARSRELQKEQGYTFIHPYDDPDVIAGQGTVALEIVRQYSAAIDAVFIPVGGGGLISGMATCLKSMRPEIKVVGVEAQDSACLSAALEAGERVKLDQVGIFADGVAVREVGALPFEIARELVDEVVTVDTDEICG